MVAMGRCTDTHTTPRTCLPQMNWPGEHARRLTTLEGVTGAYLVAALCMALAVVLRILEEDFADLVMWVKNKCTPCNSSLKCSLARISTVCSSSCWKKNESEPRDQENKNPKRLWPEATLKEVQDITDLVAFAAPLTMMYHRLNESNAALSGLRSAVLIQQQQQPVPLPTQTQTQTGPQTQTQSQTKTQTQTQMSTSQEAVARPTVIKEPEISFQGVGYVSRVLGAPVQTLPWTRNSASLQKKSSFARSFSSAIGLPGLFATTTAPNYAVAPESTSELPPLMQLKELPRSIEHRASLASLVLPSLQDLDDALPELANGDRPSMRQRGEGGKTEDHANGKGADESTGVMSEPVSMQHLKEQKGAPTRLLFVDQTEVNATVVHWASPDAAEPSVLQRSLDSHALQQLRDKVEMQQEAFASKAELGFLDEIVRGTNTQQKAELLREQEHLVALELQLVEGQEATGYQRALSSASEAPRTAVEQQRLEQQKMLLETIKKQEAGTEAAAKAKAKQEEEQQAAVAKEEVKAKQRLDEAKEEQRLAAQEAQARFPKTLNPKQLTLNSKQ